MDLVLAAGLLSPNVGLAVWLAIAFVILLFVLGKYAWGPITSALEERERTIEDSITRAERANAEAQKLLADNETARREAEGQAQKILAEARAEADRQREAAKVSLRDELAAEREKATADIDLQKQRVLGEIRAEVADMAVTAAEKILREKIDASEQARLVDQFVADLPKN